MRHFKAQSFLEYSILLSLIFLALLGMQVYARRGIQAVIKDASDELGPQEVQTSSIKEATTDSRSISSTSQSITRRQTNKAFRKDLDVTTNTASNTTSVERETGIEVPGN